MLRIIDQKTGKAISLKDQEKLCASDRTQNVGKHFDPTIKRIVKKGAPITKGGLTQAKAVVEEVKAKKVEKK